MPEEEPEPSETAESLNSEEEDGIIEALADGDSDWIKGPDGKFQGRKPSKGTKPESGKKNASSEAPGKRANPRKKNSTDNKYSPSQRRNSGGIILAPKKYSKLCGIMGTQHPNTKKGQKVSFRDKAYTYFVTADGYGGFTLNRKISNNTKRKK